MSGDFRIKAAGDSGLVVEFADRIDTAVSARVLELDRAVVAARIDGVLETLPTYRTLFVRFVRAREALSPRHENGPRRNLRGPFPVVAGTGFEPATSGL